ncbi:Vesicle transport v-SNARE 11 [Hibiscus syriacus]|uniref:Vesicle transport v-SNARE 11 n=1 Tax=Hibiscus syriacus TaxID=106335 RepID=A0A6A2WVX0_HIBSY|nr:Vesicle transport v-SNARE 11 [Hibiscus syriacus]
MSEVFDGYERHYCELSAYLTRSCASAAVLNGERDVQKYHMAMQGDKVAGRAWRPPWSPRVHGDLGADVLGNPWKSKCTLVLNAWVSAQLVKCYFKEQKKQKLSEIQAGLDDADALIWKMDLEARSLQPSIKATLLAKMIATSCWGQERRIQRW